MPGSGGAQRNLTNINARCGEGQHGWCVGRVYIWPTDELHARITDCACGCGCSKRVPVSRAGAARTRARQLAERATRRRSRTANGGQ